MAIIMIITCLCYGKINALLTSYSSRVIITCTLAIKALLTMTCYSLDDHIFSMHSYPHLFEIRERERESLCNYKTLEYARISHFLLTFLYTIAGSRQPRT